MIKPIVQRFFCLVLAFSLAACVLQKPPAQVKSPKVIPSQAPQSTAQKKTSLPPIPQPTSTIIPVQDGQLTVLLGRPTDDSISLALLSTASQQVTLAYGLESKKYTYQTGQIVLQANHPQMVEINQLRPDTAYYYTVMTNSAALAEHTFHTQRAPGSEFVFTVDADPHNRDDRFNGELYRSALGNVLSARPDFHIDLGDTFMTEKTKPQSYAEAANTFTEMLPYFGVIGADVPLYLVNGNHEGELGWLLPRGKETKLPVWAAQLRQAYYPNPVPNAFYSGSTTVDPALGAVRDGYYAWTWGDALFVVLDPFWYTANKPKSEDLDNNWNWTLGKEQYDWLKNTLETSSTKYKFVFTHHLVGGVNEGRGGVEAAKFFEWGGKNADGSDGFDQHRPGWGLPIQQLLVNNKVSAVFHGHDHVFVKQEWQGIIYQEVPQPSNADYNNSRMAADYGYVQGDVLGSSGILRVSVSPQQVTIDYVRAYLAQDEKAGQKNGQVDFTYTILPTQP